MIKREQYVNLGKNVLKILSGIVFVYVLTKIIAHTPLIEVMQNVSEEEMKSFLENIDTEIFSSLMKLYIISYILFRFLPDKIRKSHWYFRIIYFLLFYLLNITIYLWI